MRLDVNPTRMELLRLKNRTSLARRGHKLLKEKEEELLKRLIPLARATREERREVEERLKSAFQKYLFARGGMDPEVLSSSLLFTQRSLEVKIHHSPLLNLRLPHYRLRDRKTFEPSYGYWGTSGELERALEEYDLALESLLHLSEKMSSLYLLVRELVKTRRRVRALEYRLIPDLEETIAFIQMKLSEVERENLTRLLKVKERMEREEFKEGLEMRGFEC